MVDAVGVVGAVQHVFDRIQRRHETLLELLRQRRSDTRWVRRLERRQQLRLNRARAQIYTISLELSEKLEESLMVDRAFRECRSHVVSRWGTAKPLTIPKRHDPRQLRPGRVDAEARQQAIRIPHKHDDLVARKKRVMGNVLHLEEVHESEGDSGQLPLVVALKDHRLRRILG